MTRFWIFISILIFAVSFVFIPVKEAGASKAVVKKSVDPPKVIRIDRTDFPNLFLAQPNLEGDAVWMLQARLRELGYGLQPTGVYDPLTSEIVQLFQLANKMKTDGVVTSSVWKKLMFEDESQECLTGQEKNKKIRIEIDIVKHSLTVFENNQIIKKYPVGVGKGSTPSPLGEWRIVQKGVGWGNGFGTRWMGLNVPWGIYGVHGTDKPYSVGRSESHGCIRMRNKDVEALYPLIPMGTIVKIVEDGQIFPKDFKAQKLNKKCSGQNVVYLQSRLKEKGILFDIADGRYGNMTELAVKYYQIWHGLKATGEADKETYQSLGMIK